MPLDIRIMRCGERPKQSIRRCFLLPVVSTGLFVAALTTARWHTKQESVSVTTGLAGDDPAAEAQLRRYWLDPPSMLPYNLIDELAYLNVAKGSTWDFINHYITRLFTEETGGFFVEAGALDGQMLSNTLWLEQEKGWNGLLVEPDPFSYSRLLAKHRKVWTSNTCLSRGLLTNTSVHVSLSLPPDYSSPRWYMKGASYELGVSLNDPGIQHYLSAAIRSYSLVSCFPLLTYLRVLNVTIIDLLSLDTQGSELSIIKTIPWGEVRVRVVVVEVIALHFDYDFVEYMRNHGFTLVGHFQDYVFVLEGDPALARLTAHKDWHLNTTGWK